MDINKVTNMTKQETGLHISFFVHNKLLIDQKKITFLHPADGKYLVLTRNHLTEQDKLLCNTHNFN